MKLKNNNKKRTILIIAIVAVIVVALIVAGVLIFFNSKRGDVLKPHDITGVELSAPPSQTVYFIGEQFNPEGAKIYVKTYDYDESYFVDHTQLKYSGFDSSTVGEKVITVTYNGFTTTFKVTVKEHESAAPVLTSIRMGERFKSTYTLDDWNNHGPKVNTATLILVYSDGSEKEVGMKRSYCSGINDVDATGTTQFTVTYEEAGIVVSTTVTVTITN